MARKKKDSRLREHVARTWTWLAGEQGESPGRWGRLIRFTAAAGLLVALAGAALVHLNAYVRTLPEMTSSQVAISFYEEPDWMLGSLAREILEEAKKPIYDALIQAHRRGEDHLLPKLFAEQLAANGWVKRVHWVRRSSQGRMQAYCEFRRPAGAVAVGPWRRLLDEDGYVLPGRREPEAVGKCGLIEILGAGADPPRTGMPWIHPGVLSALKLIALVEPMRFCHQIKAVDISNFQGRLRPNECWILLVTDRDTTIRWGRPPGEEKGLEITSPEKLALLGGIYRDHGHIDLGKSFVDVRRSATEVDVSIASAGAAPQ